MRTEFYITLIGAIIMRRSTVSTIRALDNPDSLPLHALDGDMRYPMMMTLLNIGFSRVIAPLILLQMQLDFI
jgi:hypothetical protein